MKLERTKKCFTGAEKNDSLWVSGGARVRQFEAVEKNTVKVSSQGGWHVI